MLVQQRARQLRSELAQKIQGAIRFSQPPLCIDCEQTIDGFARELESIGA
jgi:hypothetical protein